MHPLKHLRQAVHEWIAWIDAICINQEDVLERESVFPAEVVATNDEPQNRQPSIMPYIYQRKKCVVVSL